MRKKLLWAVSVMTLVALVIGFTIYSNDVLAENTYSIDLESSSNQYLSISDAIQSGLDLMGDMTIEAWVKLESVPGNNKSMAIVSKYRQSGDQRSYHLFYYQDANDNEFIGFYTTSNGTSDSSGKFWLSPISALSIGAWYHIAVTLDVSATTARIYVNGQLHDTNTSHGGSIYNSTAPIEIGAGGDGPTYFWDGLIDDVRIWNISRTETEILDDMSRELYGNETGLVGYWKLNNTLSDETNNGNNLTNNNSTSHSSSTAFITFTESLKAYKSSNESIANSTVLQNDDELVLSLSANKTYSINGIIFATSTSATPDIKISFYGQTGSDIAIGYTNDRDEMVLFSGDESNTIGLVANTPQSIHIKGTVKTGSESGNLQLKWSQSTSNTNATTVMKGGYLKAEEL